MKLAYKLFRVRKDGSLGSLFINRPARIPVGKKVIAEPHLTVGFKYRPGFHACSEPVAPHLSLRGRRWYKVKLYNITKHKRPQNHGGLWYTARAMKVIGPHT